MRGRRRWSVVGVVLAAALPAIALGIGLLSGDTERIVSYFEVATLETSEGESRARVEEVIDYDFGAASERHGIFRIVPGLGDPATLTVASPTAPDQIEVVGDRIRIGHPDITVSGSHRYEIAYDIGSLVEDDVLAWDIVGPEWDVRSETVEAHVRSDRELLDLACDQGTVGAEGGCEAEAVGPGHVVVRTGPVSAGHAVTVWATLGDPVPLPDAPAVPPVPESSDGPVLAPALLGWLAAALAGLVTMQVVRRMGREEAPLGHLVSGVPGLGAEGERVDAADLIADAPPQVAPPRMLTAAQGGVVHAETVRAEHQAAWLLDQAHVGTVALEGDDPDKPTLRWLGGASADANAALLTMFHGRPSVQLGKHDKHFESGWKMVAAELESWRESSGLWSPAGERRRRWAIGLGIVLIVLGVLGAGFLAHWWALSSPPVLLLTLLCVPAGIGLGMLLRAWELRVRTAEGSARYVEVEAFRQYLAAAEVADVERAAEAGQLHEHLAWAVALGESDAWRKAVERSSAGRRESYYDPTWLYIASSLHSTTSATATAPSSSSGGGGGAGGGGGGGGGGSW